MEGITDQSKLRKKDGRTSVYLILDHKQHLLIF